MNQPDVWKDIKKRELEQIRVEEDDQIKKDREIPLEESSEKEDDLIDALEAEFKQDVANILSDKIRDIQTKDLKKEREEAANVIKNTLKQKRMSKASDMKKSEAKRDKSMKLEKTQDFEKAWNMGFEGGSEEVLPEENPILFHNMDQEKEKGKKEKKFQLKPLKIDEFGNNYSELEKGEKKKGDKTEDYKEKRKEFLEKQKKKKSEENIRPEVEKKAEKTKKCCIF